MRELALFAGAGGGILGGLLLGWRTVCAVEIDAYARSVLLARQRDGMLERFPIWDDVRTFDGVAWRGHVDVISGGFPCQDISSAGTRTGLDGERSGLWREYARIIGEVEPSHVFIENSPHLRTRGLVTVLQDLARLGFDARWGVLGAQAVGAPHVRKRMWIVANTNRSGQRSEPEHAEVARTQAPGCDVLPSAVSASIGRRSRWAGRSAASLAGQQQFTFQPADPNGKALREQPGRLGGQSGQSQALQGGPDWWPVDLVSGMDDGVAARMDRVRATGNGQVPGVAALAWRIFNAA